MELDKVYFIDHLIKVVFPVSKTYRTEGLDNLWEHREDKEPGSVFMKGTDKYMADWERVKPYNRHATALIKTRSVRLAVPMDLSKIT